MSRKVRFDDPDTLPITFLTREGLPTTWTQGMIPDMHVLGVNNRLHSEGNWGLEKGVIWLMLVIKIH